MRVVNDADLLSSCLELAQDEPAEVAIVFGTTWFGADL
jgi:hypothetical protein